MGTWILSLFLLGSLDVTAAELQAKAEMVLTEPQELRWTKASFELSTRLTESFDEQELTENLKALLELDALELDVYIDEYPPVTRELTWKDSHSGFGITLRFEGEITSGSDFLLTAKSPDSPHNFLRLHANFTTGLKEMQLIDAEGWNVRKDAIFNALLEPSMWQIYVDQPVLDLAEIYPEAVPFQLSADAVTLAVLDSGVDYNHPGLAANLPRQSVNGETQLWAGYDFSGIRQRLEEKLFGDPDAEVPSPEEGVFILDQKIRTLNLDDALELGDRLPYDIHVRDDGTHGTGVAWLACRADDRIRLLPIVNGSDFYRESIDYAVSMGAKIINMSFEVYVDHPDLSPEKYAWLQGEMREAILAHPDVLFVVAAGNDGKDLDRFLRYPASFDFENVLTVAALVKNEDSWDLWEHSNFGGPVDLAAPGVDVHTAEVHGAWQKATGTSYAAPQVAHALALLWHERPDLSVAELRQVFLSQLKRIPELEPRVPGGLVFIP